METIFLAFGVVFLAELGDKSQLAALSFGTRFPARWVVVGIAVSSLVTQALAVLLGATLGALLPTGPVAVVAGLLFLAFAWWTVRQPAEDASRDAQRSVQVTRGMSVAATVAVTVIVAEIGDKTMLATLTLAARTDPVAVLVGAAAGMLAAGVLAVFAGRELRKRVPEPLLRGVAASAFAAAGVWLLVTAALS